MTTTVCPMDVCARMVGMTIARVNVDNFVRAASGSWASVEDDLQIHHHHDGHVQHIVRLQTTVDSPWSATAKLIIEPGKQLSLKATELREFALGVEGLPE